MELENVNKQLPETFSKKQVNRSGDFLAKNINSKSEDEHSNYHWDVFNYWKSLHSYVMNIMYTNLKRKISKIQEDEINSLKKTQDKEKQAYILKNLLKDFIIVQRLKRTPSILGKLNRFKNMQLSRMQDIAGIRIIVNNISDIYKIRDNITSSIKKNSHQITYEKNYINYPKEDGYRCFHMIFEIRGLKEDKYNGLSVELQIRTKLQHQWATAVEIIGLYTKTSYKSGLGDEKIREFLCLCSNLLAIKEETPIHEKYYTKTEKELCKLLKSLNDELNILDYLKGLTVAVHHQKNIQQNKNTIYLALLKLDEKKLRLLSYSSVIEAEKKYAELEKQIHLTQKEWDVVLISLDDIKSIRKAFPNYYLDSREFTKTIENFIKKAEI